MQIKKDIYNCAVKQNTARMQITLFSNCLQTNLKQIQALYIRAYWKNKNLKIDLISSKIPCVYT